MTLVDFSVDGRVHGGELSAVATAADPLVSGRVHDLRDGVFTRAVLLDVAASWVARGWGPWAAIRPAEFEAAEEAAGVRVGPGDALLLRTGWPRRGAHVGPPAERKHRRLPNTTGSPVSRP